MTSKKYANIALITTVCSFGMAVALEPQLNTAVLLLLYSIAITAIIFAIIFAFDKKLKVNLTQAHDNNTCDACNENSVELIRLNHKNICIKCKEHEIQKLIENVDDGIY